MKRRDLKILWSSNALWSNSGYGQFSLDFLPRVKNDGWNVRSIAWAGLTGGSIEYKGIYCYPQCGDIWGSDAMVLHGRHFGADVNFCMQDVWALDPNWIQQLKHLIPYVPIDRDPIPAPVLDRLRFSYKIITFSKFGQKALQKAGFASMYIPEGVDTSVFKPLDKMKCRAEMNVPQDKFVVGMIGANKPDGYQRKGWEQALDAFKLFHDKHPESIFFYECNQPGGFDIQGYANYLGILPQLMTPDPYMAIYHGTPEIVNKWINCFDLTLHPSTTEGFGLMIPQSQAAGVPIVVNNCTSMPELIIEGKTGEMAEPVFKQYQGGGGFIHFAGAESIFEKMELLYGRIKENQNKIKIDCRNFVVENYSIDTIFEKMWVPYIENLQNEILPIVDKKE